MTGPQLNVGTWAEFERDVRQVFEPKEEAADAFVAINRLKFTIGKNSMENHVEHFKHLANLAKVTDDHTLHELFRNTLPSNYNRIIFVSTNPPTTAKGLYDMAIALDQNNRQAMIRDGKRNFVPGVTFFQKSSTTSSNPAKDPWAMDVDALDDIEEDGEEEDNEAEDEDEEDHEDGLDLQAVLTPEQYKRYKQGLCLHCGKKGHYAKQCPVRLANPKSKKNVKKKAFKPQVQQLRAAIANCDEDDLQQTLDEGHLPPALEDF
jgi:hypothetical protein